MCTFWPISRVVWKLLTCTPPHSMARKCAFCSSGSGTDFTPTREADGGRASSGDKEAAGGTKAASREVRKFASPANKKAPAGCFLLHERKSKDPRLRVQTEACLG